MGGFRLGRIKNTVGFFNETRDVAFTRPSIFLSPGIYRDHLLREPVLSSDAIAFFHNYLMDHGDLEFDFSYGWIRDDNLENSPVFGNRSDVTVSEGFGYRLVYIHSSYQTKFSIFGNFVDSVQLDTPLDVSAFTGSPSGTDILEVSSNILVRFFVASFQQTIGTWTFTAEYGNIRYDTNEENELIGDAAIIGALPTNFLDLVEPLDLTSEIYYLQIDKWINKEFTIYTKFDIFYIDKYDKSGQSFEAEGDGLFYSRFIKDYLLGLKWVPKKDMLFRFEYHYVDGTGWLNPNDNPNFLENSTRYWNIIAASFSYRF